MRQVGESKAGDGRPERSSGTEEMRGRWDLSRERRRLKIRTARFLRASVAAGSGVSTAVSSERATGRRDEAHLVASAPRRAAAAAARGA